VIASSPAAPVRGGDTGFAPRVPRALQTVGGQDWATLVFVLVPSSVNGGSSAYMQTLVLIVTYATSASYFPLTTAAWAPAWAIAPAAWAGVVGSPVALSGPVTLNTGISFSPLPTAAAPSASPLAGPTMLGLGLGIGLGLAAILAVAAIVAFWCAHRSRTAAIFAYAKPAAPDAPAGKVLQAAV
jgi:hypothetical protein